jgi:hypothetical protein
MQATMDIQTDSPLLSQRIIERLLETKQVTLKRLLDQSYRAGIFAIRDEDDDLSHPAERKASGTEKWKWTRWQLYVHVHHDEDEYFAHANADEVLLQCGLLKDEVPVDRYAKILHGLLPYEKGMAQTALNVAKEEASKLVLSTSKSKDGEEEGQSHNKRKASCDSSKNKEGLEHSTPTAPAQKKPKK